MSRISFAVLVGILLELALCYSLTNTTKSGGNTYQLRLLGVVGKKQYFVENKKNMDWFYAEYFCETSGLTIASIKTQEEANFLRGAFHPTNFNGSFWTAARDRTLYQEFFWENTDPREIVQPYLSGMGYHARPSDCLIYENYIGGHMYFQFRCDENDVSDGVLCEYVM